MAAATSFRAYQRCTIVLITVAFMLIVIGLGGSKKLDTSLDFSEFLFPGAAAQTDNNTATSPGNSTSNADIEFLSNIELVKGHLAQAVENKQADQLDLAKQEVSEALNERYSAILEPRISSIDANLNSTIKSGLANLSNKADSLGVSEFRTNVQNITNQLDLAASKVISPSERADSRFNASVIASIVNRAAGEYTEAVSAQGKVDKQFEYQVAQAFTNRAESMLNSTSFAGNSTMSDARASTLALFAQLKSDMDSVHASTAIQSTADGIVGTIDKIAGISAPTSTNSSDNAAIINYVTKAQALLKQALAEYKNGNYTGANALATTAYLDNYENVEPVLIKTGYGDLESQTEQMMRLDLRQMVNEKAPYDQVANLINSINQNLDRIVTVMPEFPVNGIAATSAIAIALLLGMRLMKTKRNSSSLLG